MEPTKYQCNYCDYSLPYNSKIRLFALPLCRYHGIKMSLCYEKRKIVEILKGSGLKSHGI